MAQTIRSLRTAYDGWLKVQIAEIETGSGALAKREVIERGEAVAVLPYDPERRTAILVRQPRAPVQIAIGAESILEAIAGVVEEESFEETARREALEEAGLALRLLEPVAVAFTSPGFTTERIGLYLAPYTISDRVGEGGGVAEEHEEIEVVELPLERLATLADSGGVQDAKTLAMIQTLRLRRPDLFGG
ncbi:MAG: NUDIX hydrolase [Proteobacteria bacterium]|nr:NUDIX hydrolase [Pseudomonadota bacterium]